MTSKELITQALATGMPKYLGLHHTLYSLVRCKDIMLEELITKALADANIDHEWSYGSHGVVTDITLATGETISVKSGIWNQKKNILTFSGSRLGSYPTLQDKYNRIVDTKPDFYIFGSTPKNPALKTAHEYAFFILTGDEVNYGDFTDWVDGPRPTVTTPAVTASINATMSHQLWTDVDLTHIGATPDKVVIQI